MKAIIVVLAGKGDTVVAICASTLNAIDLARFIAAELAEVALIPTNRNADLFLVASKLILNVAALRIATNVQFIN